MGARCGNRLSVTRAFVVPAAFRPEASIPCGMEGGLSERVLGRWCANYR